MGKYKFRLSDMVPNAWFYKLRDMSRNKRKHQNYSRRESFSRKSFTSLSSPKLSFVSNRASYYYSTSFVETRKSLNSPIRLTKRLDHVDLPLDTPRKSVSRSHRRHCKVLISSLSPKRVSISSSLQCNSSSKRSELEKDPSENYETCLSECEKTTESTDFNSDTDQKSSVSNRLEDNKNSSKMIELVLSPIRTKANKPFKDNDDSFHREKKRHHLKAKVASPTVHKIRTRVVSPRVATKNATKEKKLNKDLKESLAVLKYSSDPQRDFTESMIEMIIANNMSSSTDLEDLLACYLSLNSVDYHSAIVQAFKKVWLDLNKLRIIE